ncbi:MAG: EAL domain-containing protein [Gammaproteobacteria bacterium]|nr:EAL domain-containing protein [Gammaproteobacteria bacterium]
MEEPRFYQFLHRQIPILIVLSDIPGLAYIFLAWFHDIHLPALIWYTSVLAISMWGFILYRKFDLAKMSKHQRDDWYKKAKIYFYLFFSLWTVIFLLYVTKEAQNLHYIAIFTQIGASVVASTLLNSDRNLYRPTLLILMVPLTIYFTFIGEWYGYVLTIFSCILTWVLFYAAKSTHDLLMKTQFQASHDQLTGLHNRYFFIDYLQQTMNSIRDNQHYASLMLIDLDHFKTVNDSLGHDIGDQLLREITQRLKQQLPDNCHLARLGGDEFMIIGNEYRLQDQCEQASLSLANKILALIKETYIIGDHHLYISASIGISMIEPISENANIFIRKADIALYEVKSNGRDGVFFFSEDMSKRVENHLEIERLLHFALEENEISLNFQPQVDNNKNIIGCETLVRWNNSKLGFIPPVEFIPIAEQTGIIIELGNHIVHQSFITLCDWNDKGINLNQFSINISMRQLIHHSFIDTVDSLSKQYLNNELCKKIVFEITESVVAEDIGRVISIMNELRKIGIRFSMDDFGTGYSSLNYLKQLPINEVKIDRTFISEVSGNTGDQAMIKTILNIAEIFGHTVVAEGVETNEQFIFLHKNNCCIFQGYLFYHPLSKDDFEKCYIEQAI